MKKSTPKMLSIILLICLGTTFAATESKLRCKESERKALLDFKQGLDGFAFHVNPLSSWSKIECCEWLGIRCDENGHVIGLDLSPPTFGVREFDGIPIIGGNFSSSILGLPFLSYLDLSHVSLYVADSIPTFLGRFRRLKYLNLSYTGITGEVPPELGNLSSLETLDLSETFKRIKTIKSMEWVSRLSSLTTLDLSFNDMSLAKDWAIIVSNLPRLSSLRLRFSQLSSDNFPLSVNSSRHLSFIDLSGNSLSPAMIQWLLNFKTLVHLDLNVCFFHGPFPDGLERLTSLEYLDLGGNSLEGPIPDSFGNYLTAMKFLSLGNNQLSGMIPKSFGNMAKLEYLDLGVNMLEGEIPRSIWEICTLREFRAHDNHLTGRILFSKSSSKCSHFSLESLNLAQNRIQGPLPDFTLYPSLISLWLKSNRLDGIATQSLGGLSRLETLDLSENSVKAVITEAHLLNLSRLRYIDFSSNSDIMFDISPNWIPPFQADSILLQSCKLGPNFPNWLRNQKSYSYLDISNSGISDSIPNWFWTLPKTALSLNLSNNQIQATSRGKNQLQFNVTYFNLSSTEFAPSPTIDLSSNLLQGSVPLFLLNMNSLYLSRNKYSDLNSLCNAKSALSLRLLDLSYNRLSGKLPDCWSNAPFMDSLIMSHNGLSGEIPSSISFMAQISTFNVSYNKFSGGLPYSLRNCTQLMVLDAGDNELSGSIPSWIGTVLQNLVVLNMRSNRLSGTVPNQLCNLKQIQVLDLSGNNFSGRVPKCVVL